MDLEKDSEWLQRQKLLGSQNAGTSGPGEDEAMHMVEMSRGLKRRVLESSDDSGEESADDEGDRVSHSRG